MKSEVASKKLTKESPFEIENDIKDIAWKKYFFQIKALSSGLLLIEVDQKPTQDKLLSVKKVHGIPVSVSPHSTMNSSKGTIFCDNIH